MVPFVRMLDGIREKLCNSAVDVASSEAGAEHPFSQSLVELSRQGYGPPLLGPPHSRKKPRSRSALLAPSMENVADAIHRVDRRRCYEADDRSKTKNPSIPRHFPKAPPNELYRITRVEFHQCQPDYRAHTNQRGPSHRFRHLQTLASRLLLKPLKWGNRPLDSTMDDTYYNTYCYNATYYYPSDCVVLLSRFVLQVSSSSEYLGFLFFFQNVKVACFP